ncbi:MAG: hypothetical protein K8F62_14225 [Pseudorhodoplanes sp.]|nr:hypothetical protein [Pseudorhodoplanes sp.]
MDITRIAEELNRRAGGHRIGQLQFIRKAMKGFERLPSRGIFTGQTIHDSWAFHHGGRSELQFNIGHEHPDGADELRHGVAFSFELSQTLPSIDVLIPKARLFNEYQQMYPDQFADMRMWHYRDGERSDDYAPGAILPELVRTGVFVFVGKRQPVADVDYDIILADFDRLLPLYEYVEGGGEQGAVPTVGFTFRPGTTARARSASATLAERQLNITLRHNLMQAALCRRLIAEHGVKNVGDEQPSGLGTKIDVVLRTGTQQYWYYEIKTASSPRGCLREALGQILEYSFWPGAREASRLIVCGESSLDADGAAYLRQLQTRFNLPIAYEQITVPSDAE